MRWLLPGAGAKDASGLSRELGLHPLVARILVNRGIESPEAASTFLTDRLADLPDPFLMKGMRPAVQRVTDALLGGQKITLYGDYDVDGVCSTALLSLFLEQVGGQIATYIPHRIGEGYGLNGQAVEKIAADGTRLLVTLDCGITSHAEVSLANVRGLDVVVVDHHAVPEVMPPAVAVLNPMQPGCDYPTRHLCAAGVAFNLCLGVRKQLREAGFFERQRLPEPNLKSMLDLVALATVADVVPLTGANRILVRHGLRELTSAKRLGIRALKSVAGLDPNLPVTATHLGFQLGPRINAAGRLSDAAVGLRLLRSSSEKEALTLAMALDSANSERQALEKEVLNEALLQAGTYGPARGLVLASAAWHPGVIGIVASRVVERFHRPTVLVSLQGGVGKGSARSIEGFSLVDALTSCSSHLVKYGGHRMAAGLTVDPAMLPAFRAAFEAVAAERLSDEDLVPRCRVDAIVSPAELDEEAVSAVEILAPFGQGNPSPVFVSQSVAVSPRVIPSKSQGKANHLKLALEEAPHLDAIGFGMEDRVQLTQGKVDLAYQVSIDSFRGRRRVSLKLKDVRASG